MSSTSWYPPDPVIEALSRVENVALVDVQEFADLCDYLHSLRVDLQPKQRFIAQGTAG
jgi:hypothetical protein